jgi:hypothetical protein
MAAAVGVQEAEVALKSNLRAPELLAMRLLSSQRYRDSLPMPHGLVAFGAIFFCGLALVPAAAHAMELPNKIRLAREEYLVAQKLYRGWQLVAPIVVLALVSTAMLVVQARTAGSRSAAASLIAFVCIAGTQVVFWTLTFPVNRATRNWTQAPPHWEKLRRRWEYSHATSAVLNLVAFGAALLTMLWSSLWS